MRVFAITRPGLTAIALSVGALWGAIGAEMVIRNRAEADLRSSFRAQPALLQPKQRTVQPASRPVRPFRPERVIPG